MINISVNTTVLDTFSRLVVKGKLAHAYLLVGPVNSGKTQTAIAVAQLVNCQEKGTVACRKCVPCLKIAAGNHPDVYVIGHEPQESIKIEDVRILLNKAHLRAFEAPWKVFIIRDIEMMTAEAANALLKTLEEPAPGTLMILTTSILEANLDTIKSRTHIIKFLPASINRMTQFLIEEGQALADARFLATFSEGTLGKVRQLIKEDIISTRQRVLDQILHNRRNDEFLKELCSDPSKASMTLQILLTFFRDVLLLKNKMPIEVLIFQSYLKDLESFAKRDMTDLTFIIRQIIATKKLLDDRLHIRMSLGLLREYLWEN